MKGFFLSIALSIIFVCSLSAHDFMATINGQKIYFNVTDSKKLTVEVTYGGSIMNIHPFNTNWLIFYKDK